MRLHRLDDEAESRGDLLARVAHPRAGDRPLLVAHTTNATAAGRAAGNATVALPLGNQSMPQRPQLISFDLH